MRFGEILGNEQLKQRLLTTLDSGKLSHCYLISGPAGSGKRTLARLLSAAMQCAAPSAPCMVCTPCRKVLSGNHPDVITVDEPEKKQVPVELIRQTRADLFIRPNEGQKKIFIIPRAQDMNAAAQNALLKILEEPPHYGVFLLLAETPEKLLPTIRSRCSELHMTPLDDTTLRAGLAARCPDRSQDELDAVMRKSGGFLGQAIALLASAESVTPQAVRFAQVYAEHDVLGLLELFCSMERMKRNQLAPVLEQMRQLLLDALKARSGSPTTSAAIRAIAARRTPRALLDACQVLQTALDDCWANVGVANICAGLFVQLRADTP